jgi:UDP-N-acetyl-D-mannosaminuronic acid dehydrogenase
MSYNIQEQEKICIVGLGYIGLPLSVFLAEKGYKVTGIDIDKEKISLLREGNCTLPEASFLKHFMAAINSNNLDFQESPIPSEVFIIAFPTPLIHETHKADLSFVTTALDSIIPHLMHSNLVILESTVPPFTCQNLIKEMIEKNTSFSVPQDILVAHCPERAYPGNLVQEFINNDRIIGGISPSSSKKAQKIYASFVKGKIFLTTDLIAETVKLAENTYRDVNIAYANELKLICDQLKIDTKEVMSLTNLHPRVDILQNGIGVGGHCVPIDPWFLWEKYPEISQLIPVARNINDNMPVYVAEKIIKMIPSDKSDPKIVLLGKTYKPEVMDTRESPALKIINIIKSRCPNVDIRSFDPKVDEGSISEIDILIESSDLLVILVPHQNIIQHVKKNTQYIQKRMRTPNIIFADEL